MAMENTSIDGLVSRLYSDLPLRPPIPLTDRASLVVYPSRWFPSPEFLFRMCIASKVLRLTTETRFTALVLLHRYSYARIAQTQNFKEDFHNDKDECHDWTWIGAMCLFLACKTEDEPRRLRDIVNMVRSVLSEDSSANHHGTNNVNVDGKELEGEKILPSANMAQDFVVVTNLWSSPLALDDHYWECKKRAIEMEQKLLRWLAFDTSVSHPHRAVIWILRNQISSGKTEEIPNAHRRSTDLSHKNRQVKSDPIDVAFESHEKQCNGYGGYGKLNKETKDKVVHLAFRRLNDALFFPKALTWGVIELACAAIDLAATSFETTEPQTATNIKREFMLGGGSGGGWWGRYGVSQADFEECKSHLEEAKLFLESFESMIST